MGSKRGNFVEAGRIPIDDGSKELITGWTNADNKEYAEKLPLIDLLHFLEVSGLAGDPDVILISDYISKSQSILEVGGGFGRVIKACQKLGYSRKLTTIEYARSYANYLNEHIKNCKIIDGDFLIHSFNESFDLILIMWTTISIFSPNEQSMCLKKCADLLMDHGYAVIDLLVTNNSTATKETNKKEYCLKDKKIGANRYAYMPSTFEIIKAAAIAGLAVRQVKEYISGTAIRCLVILGKS